MSTYRFSWHRPNGWTRLGAAGAVGILFLTPMMWALGVFGDGEDTLKRTLIFLFAGMWFFVGVGYMLGWTIRGFMVRLKDHDDDDDGPVAHRPSGAAHPPGPGAGAAHRPGH